MKFNASTPHTSTYPTALPLFGHWEKRSARRRFPVKPFALETKGPTLAERDALASKYETICAFVLGLCLLAAPVLCLTQLLS